MSSLDKMTIWDIAFHSSFTAITLMPNSRDPEEGGSFTNESMVQYISALYLRQIQEEALQCIE